MSYELRKELALPTGRLMFINHPSSQYSLEDQLEGYVAGGGRLLQIRLKDTPQPEYQRIVQRIVQVMDNLGGSVIVNDHPQIAKTTGAWGVHVGQRDATPQQIRKEIGSALAIGVTVNTLDQVLALKDAPIDYLGLGPLRFTDTKKNLAPILGIEGVRRIIADARAAGVRFPFFVIGGVEAMDVRTLLEIGAHGVAVSASIATASDPSFATEKFLESIVKTLR